MASKLQKVNQMKAEWLQSLSDEELEAIAEKDLDLTGFTAHELDQIINNNASPGLLARVEATRKKP